MAALGVEAAVNAVQGKPVEPFIDTGTELVTNDNAAQFLDVPVTRAGAVARCSRRARRADAKGIRCRRPC